QNRLRLPLAASNAIGKSIAVLPFDSLVRASEWRIKLLCKDSKGVHRLARKSPARFGLHRRAQSPLAGACGLPLSLCDWYPALFANCFGTLGNTHLQDTVVKTGFNFVLIDRIWEAE